MSLYIQQIYRIYGPSSAKQSAIYQPQSSTAYPTTISPERPKLDRGRTNAEGSRGSGKFPSAWTEIRAAPCRSGASTKTSGLGSLVEKFRSSTHIWLAISTARHIRKNPSIDSYPHVARCLCKLPSAWTEIRAAPCRSGASTKTSGLGPLVEKSVLRSTYIFGWRHRLLATYAKIL
eukprot:CAMPEP_0185825686 /NCGR_PEP_ID=MMETSP1322-20130828/31173_1 /TAXON_ID=265543 /ORGANISM="Minutocellus polymorphus, Strain RCC2270" /LENGTH=175 /DNA_ID=CAMNT_0028523411 /DNA_START=615 /DNA_END=1138 /DNA_ORIENTATION=-